MRKIWTGDHLNPTPYRPWSEERKYARRALIAKAHGRELNEPKRVYCGPYLIALPPPSWWRGFIPSIPPFRIRVVRLSDGAEWSSDDIHDMRTAMWRLHYLIVESGQMAELLDAKDGWIARVTPQSPAAGQASQ